jgi:hypothetical protein
MFCAAFGAVNVFTNPSSQDTHAEALEQREQRQVHLHSAESRQRWNIVQKGGSSRVAIYWKGVLVKDKRLYANP